MISRTCRHVIVNEKKKRKFLEVSPVASPVLRYHVKGNTNRLLCASQRLTQSVSVCLRYRSVNTYQSCLKIRLHRTCCELTAVLGLHSLFNFGHCAACMQIPKFHGICVGFSSSYLQR